MPLRLVGGGLARGGDGPPASVVAAQRRVKLSRGGAQAFVRALDAWCITDCIMMRWCYHSMMRTTVDLDSHLLEPAKRLALKEQRTLSAVISDALAAYLASRRQSSKDVAFELLVRGNPRGRFPAAADIAAAEDEDDIAALGLRKGRTRASS
jgi:predicted transcriptional regulator